MARKQWDEKERKDTKIFDSKRTPRSGGLWFIKGDSKSARFLVENKTTTNESFGVSTKLWEKISHEAIKSQRIPLMSLEIGKKKIGLVVIDINDFAEMLEKV